jgi:hypothetical protein
MNERREYNFYYLQILNIVLGKSVRRNFENLNDNYFLLLLELLCLCH